MTSTFWMFRKHTYQYKHYLLLLNVALETLATKKVLLSSAQVIQFRFVDYTK